MQDFYVMMVSADCMFDPADAQANGKMFTAGSARQAALEALDEDGKPYMDVVVVEAVGGNWTCFRATSEVIWQVKPYERGAAGTMPAC